MAVTNVLIVDDHAFVRACLRALLEGEDDLQVVGECADGADLLSACAAAEVDVVLMDLRMPRMSGIDATRTLLTSDRTARVLLMTSRITGDDVARAADAGAAGFLLKGGHPELLLEAIRTVARGGSAWLGEIAAVV